MFLAAERKDKDQWKLLGHQVEIVGEVPSSIPECFNVRFGCIVPHV